MSLVLSPSRLVPVLSHGGTGSTLYSLHSPKVEPGVHHVEEDVEIGACVRWRSRSRSEIFLTGVRCGEVIFEGGAKPWSVGDKVPYFAEIWTRFKAERAGPSMAV